MVRSSRSGYLAGGRSPRRVMCSPGMETNASRRSPGRGPGIGLALCIGRAFDIARL